MSVRAFIEAPLRGTTSLSKVFWLYGVAGSLVYGALEFFLDPGNAAVMRIYTIGGLLFTVYVTVGTYQCAMNCRSPFIGRLARISAVISLLLLPVFAYLDLTGALSLAAFGTGQMPDF